MAQILGNFPMRQMTSLRQLVQVAMSDCDPSLFAPLAQDVVEKG